VIQFGQHAPDQAALDNPGANEAKNCIPRTQGSYGPLGGLSSISDAINERPQGAFSAKDGDGNTYTFCGDDTDLYRLSGASWSEISKTTGAYTVAADGHVAFAQFGDRVISVNGHTDTPQSFVLGSSSDFADLGGTPPRARRIGVIKDFVFLGDTWDSTDGSVGNRVWWPAINDPTDWPTIGSSDAAQKQSDRQDLPIGGRVMALTGAIGGMDGAIFMEKAIYRVQYQGPPTVFGFFEVERDRGVLASRSLVNVGPFGFYIGEEDLYRFDGAGSTPIGDQRVSKTFFNDLDQNHLDRVYGAADTINKMTFWLYPGSDNVGGQPNRLLIYNWTLDRWSVADTTGEVIFRDLSAGYTLEQLDSFGTMETLPASLDSRQWQGGATLLSMFNSDKKLCRFTGDALEATFETSETGGKQRLFVEGIRPYVDGGTVTVQLRHRDAPGDDLTDTDFNSVDADGEAHFDISARYARAKVKIASGGDWSHAQGVDFTAQPDGGL